MVVNGTARAKDPFRVVLHQRCLGLMNRKRAKVLSASNEAGDERKRLSRRVAGERRERGFFRAGEDVRGPRGTERKSRWDAAERIGETRAAGSSGSIGA
jgi:hypothetical protein